MSRTRTGVFGADAVAAPIYEPLSLTVPAKERLAKSGNKVELIASESITLYRVTLAGDVPDNLVLCLVGHGNDQHRALRTTDEPQYPGEWPDEAIAWHDHGDWVGCPACRAALVWYEAGYVPGYRICARKPYHHAQLSNDGRSAISIHK